jgi:hypothetical protein
LGGRIRPTPYEAAVQAAARAAWESDAAATDRAFVAAAGAWIGRRLDDDDYVSRADVDLVAADVLCAMVTLFMDAVPQMAAAV